MAGISCGLIQDDDGSFTTFIDIQGVEDFHGEMDFKVGGTKKGITAIQMDLKNDGLTMVNNYTKSGLVPRADGKKYGREHLAYLTAICILKRVMSAKDMPARCCGWRTSPNGWMP